MDFDTLIDRRGTHCAKWDMMESLYGVSPDEGLAMWVADMDFPVPPAVTDKMREMADHGVYGYVNCDEPYKNAIQWWMQNRHGWQVEADAIFTTTGLVNGVGMCLDTFTQPGDGIVLFTPVYHAFAKVIRNAGREVVECLMTNNNGRYEMDFDAYDAQMTGNEKMVILCSPHNPGGRVWSQEELQAVADFAKRHDLILLSDEIHHDLVYPGHTHIPMQNAVPEVTERLLMLTAPSKTFNFAGLHTGQVIIPDPHLREQFQRRMLALALAPNSAGQYATAAAYSPEGAAWADQLIAYLDGNRKVFDAAIEKIPGLSSMPLAATYLSWVDFSGTGMSREEFTKRVEQGAKIAGNHGTTFGTGGENFLRFNLGTQRSRIEEACRRLTEAFSDLQ
ncbi:pyridoxal phosphate-dependent aminotransferase [Phaeobacter gallaeciensis]|uniref:MalY/PatB family protein n=1 Tax=Phaeobacter gallaeciensis TaxID=60890 RepID=UPI00238031FF|nr:MalY/PatB family protein [Phaeobacter gallaeciensis]MDE4275693.1 pyridoxal phosphate-dependent aminotransferase [Phaeobacter gallaeciensis]MDE4301094.1 pyridoxal phosphate-dependent aminotransferase [Phaeobacter gallaeciensis]MDE5186258.1 pyridoxal phosphate-dependent aminotransferase [Phaeobacter gallaeciensis]